MQQQISKINGIDIAAVIDEATMYSCLSNLSAKL